jgi:hypothetical protein
MMNSTSNLIRLQRGLKDHVKGEYEFRNTRNGTRIITKEMADYSAMKSYLERNNLNYFTFSPNSEKTIKAVILHIPPDTPAKDTTTTALRTFRLQRHQRETNDGHSNNTQRTNPHGTSPFISSYFNNKYKRSRDIQSE